MPSVWNPDGTDAFDVQITMSESSNSLPRRSVLTALASIGVGSVTVGAGTYAAFSDTETSSSGLTTESITLQKGSQTLDFTTGNILPGDSGSSSVRLESTGSTGGRLDVTIADITNTDVDSTTPEENAEDGTNVPLSEALELKMWVEQASSGSGTEGEFDPQYDYGLKQNGDVAHGDGASLSFANAAQYPLDTPYQTMSFRRREPDR